MLSKDCNCIHMSGITGMEVYRRDTQQTIRVYNNQVMKPIGVIRLQIKNTKRPLKIYEGDIYVVEDTNRAGLSKRTMEQIGLVSGYVPY